MKRLIMILCILTMAGSVAFAETAHNIIEQKRWTGLYDMSAVPRYLRVDQTILFVDSGHSQARDAADGIHGEEWELPFATAAYAETQLPSTGGVICVAPGHTETIDSATEFILNVSDTTLLGFGLGDDRPTFTLDTAATAEISIDADNVAIVNCRFLNGYEVAVNAAFLDNYIVISNKYWLLKDCYFGEGGDDGDANSTTVVTIGVANNDADFGRMDGCDFHLPSITNYAQAIDFATDQNSVTISNSDIYGDFSEAGIDIPVGGNLQANLLIEQCYITNNETGQHAIQANGTGNTGMVKDCILETDGTHIDAGGLQVVNTPYLTTGTDADTDVVAWDLATNYLDHLMYVAVANSSTFAASITDDSVLANLMTKTDGDVSDYDFTTDSLEAIADALAAGTGASTANDSDNLDELTSSTTGVAADADPSAKIVDLSVFAHIMGNDATTDDYDASTDSLEAISVALAAGTGATAAIDADNLDHLASTDTGVAADDSLATLVVDGSILAHLMDAGAAVADYDASTDSLQAIADALAVVQADTDLLDTSAELVALVDPNYVSYDAPRLAYDITGAMGGGDYDTADSPRDIFTVTGNIACRLVAIIDTQVTSVATNGTLEVGVAGDTACLLVQDVVDGTEFDASDVWTLDQVPETPSAEMPSTWVIIPNGLDIEMVIGTNNMTAGVMEFHLEWIPLSADAAVVPALPAP